MKRALQLALLTTLTPTESRACCDEVGAVELLGWSRDGSQALVRVPSNMGDESEPEAPWYEVRVLDVRSGRLLERVAALPEDCGWEEVQKNPSLVETLLRLERIAPVAAEPMRWMNGLGASVKYAKGTLTPRAFTLVKLAETESGETTAETLMTLRGRPSDEYNSDVWVSRSPDGRHAAVFGGSECGPGTMPVFVTAAELARIESHAAPAAHDDWTPAPPVPVRSIAETDLAGRESLLMGWSRDGARSIFGLVGEENVQYLQLRDTRTGRAIETLDLGTMDPPRICNWQRVQEDPDGVRAVLRLARLAPVESAASEELGDRTFSLSPDGKRVAVFEGNSFAGFVSRRELARMREPAARAADASVAREAAPAPVPVAATTARPVTGGVRCVSPGDVVVLARRGEEVLPAGPITLETGSKTLVWGGEWGGLFDRDGTWRDLPPAGAPFAPRCTAVWTGAEMIVWSDRQGGPSGGRYDLARDTWTPMATPDLPLFGASVWTGIEMLVWDPVLETGGLYDSSADLWSLFHAAGAPPRGHATAVFWTGSDLIVSNEDDGRAWRYDVDGARWASTFLTVSAACENPRPSPAP